MIINFSRIVSITVVIALLCGCGNKSPMQRKYIKELFWGHWQGKSITVFEHSKDDRHLSNTPIPYRVEKYGRMQCTLNPDDTYKLDLAITKEICGRDFQGKMEYDNVLISAGYKLLTTGHFTYTDSTVEFLNYQNTKELRGILYNYDDDLYLTLTDKYQNKWNIQFVRTN